MKKNLLIAAVAAIFSITAMAGCADTPKNEKAKVYITKEITPESLIKIYEALGVEPHGKVAVKLSFGEPGGHNYLKPELVGDLVRLVDGTFIEANTAYGGRRSTTEYHLQTAHDHGFTAVAPVDIIDSEGEMELPIENGKHLTRDIVGKNLANYDFLINLAHFKGHAMGGFGGVLKNMSIGIASSRGKVYIHSAGASDKEWGNPEQVDFIEAMAEASKAVANYFGDNVVYISVMNNMSVDCDCDPNPAPPQMSDIGILASTDPIALEQACVDLIYASEEHGKIHLIERMESRQGARIIAYSEELGLGTTNYELVEID